MENLEILRVFVVHMPLPDEKEIERTVVQRKKMGLLRMYVSEGILEEQSEVKEMLNVRQYGERQPRVSLWEIEPLTTFPMYPSLFPLRMKCPWHPGVSYLQELRDRKSYQIIRRRFLSGLGALRAAHVGGGDSQEFAVELFGESSSAFFPCFLQSGGEEAQWDYEREVRLVCG